MIEKLPGGPVFGINERVAYQKGSIVSTVLIRSDKGSVTLFAFDRGQELSEHTAPFDALVQLVDGEAEIRIAGEPHLLRAGQAMVMPAGKPHSVRAVRRFKMVLTMLKA